MPLGWIAAAIAIAQAPDGFVPQMIEKARGFDASLPNFICKQVTHRYTGAGLDGPWKDVDWYEHEITYFERKERSRFLTLKGKPVDAGKKQPGGLRANSMFGGMLSQIFREETKTEFEFDRNEALDGRDAVVFRYRVRRENSKWRISRPARSYVRGYTGFVWADVKTHAILRISGRAQAEPGDPAWVGQIAFDSGYGYVTIGGEERLLPLRSEVRLEDEKKARRNVMEFRDFRQYTAETKIEFGTDPPPVQ